MNYTSAFFTADILTCQSKKSSEVTNNIIAGSVLFKQVNGNQFY